MKLVTMEKRLMMKGEGTTSHGQVIYIGRMPGDWPTRAVYGSDTNLNRTTELTYCGVLRTV
jgi:hypothetical protein